MNTHDAAKSIDNAEPLSVIVRQYWASIVRRKLLVFLSILGGVAIAAVLCVVLPKIYRSSTLIMIENQKIPDDYVKGMGGASIEERLTMIQQQVMSRTLLSQIIEHFKLYRDQVERDGLESAIEQIRHSIKVETVGTAGARGKTVEAITISFSHEDPIIAMKVTENLASLFIEENLKVREQLVTGVSVFLEQELEDARKALEAQEQAISQYKTKYIGLLPEQMEANLRALDRLQADLNATDDLFHSQTDRLSTVEKSIKEYEASGGIHTNSGGSMSASAGMDPLVVRLRELERRLTTLMAEWKETYPDIGETKQEIVSVKKQLAEKYGDFVKGKDGDATKTFDPYLRELVKQRNDLRTEVSSVKERRLRLVEHIRDLEHRVEQTPSREQEVMILVRDYQNMQKNYQALLDKRLNAHVAENLEKRQKGQQFRVLDPANLPKKLDSPKRLLIMIAGLIGGCGLGLGLAIGLDQLNPTFKRREEVETMRGIRVLAAIPNFLSMDQRLDADLPPNDLTINSDGSILPPVRYGWRYRSWLPSIPRKKSLHPNVNLVAKWEPLSVAAEQYRMAATRLVLSSEGRGSTIIEVTSALKGEGKTTTAVNLGYTIARNLGKSTLLLDCDFRCPALHQYVSFPAKGGLVELLDGQALLEDCLSTIDEAPCSIISVGGTVEEQNELNRIQQLKAILPKLRTHFDYIIINTPPVLPSATMGILASLADVLILVIRAGATPKHVVKQAFTMLGLTIEKLVILNAVESHSMPHHMHGYPSSYGRKQSVESALR